MSSHWLPDPPLPEDENCDHDPNVSDEARAHLIWQLHMHHAGADCVAREAALAWLRDHGRVQLAARYDHVTDERVGAFSWLRLRWTLKQHRRASGREAVPALSPLLGVELKLTPTTSVVNEVQRFVFATLHRWDAASGTSLVTAWCRMDQQVVSRLVAVSVAAQRGRFAARRWNLLDDSGWLISDGQRYWLRIGMGRFRLHVRPRWATTQRSGRWGVDQRRPITFRMRLIETDVGPSRLRLETWDARSLHEPAPYAVAAGMAELERACARCDRFPVHNLEGWTTWAEVDFPSAA